MNGSPLRFRIAQWSWWEPPSPGANADIPEVPPLLRRRASAADRSALRVAFDCVGASGQTRAVFCSRHGEVHRSVELLEQLSRGEPLSPTAFSVSVHNAAAALYSLTRGDTSPSAALAAGADSFPQGVLEACAQLASGAEEVLVVGYDDALPAPFRAFTEPTDAACALALLLRPAEGKGFSLSLEPSGGAPSTDGAHLPLLAGFLREERNELEWVSGPRRWRWARDV